ncbi:MAG: hypothetical protein NWE93_10535 [Candidatus Bathyarchaeota archaeon]|nr:hypothetical protein [Candidatus Bathyarchaeota archaeon]
MNSKLALAVIAVLLVNVIVLAAGFLYLQGEINSLKPPQTTPTAYPTAPSEATATPAPQPTSQPLPYNYVVYEFNLKSECINNVEWLSTKTPYNQSISWKENYIAYLASLDSYPEQTRDSMASMMFSSHEFVSAEFDASTGATKATYNYLEYNGVPEFNSIETYLPNLHDGAGWNKNYL